MERRVLRFGKTPVFSPRETYRQYSHLINLLNSRLECCTLELVLAPTYADCVGMLERQEIDLAWLATATYAEKRSVVPMEPLAVPVWSGLKEYTGILFTVEATGVKTLADLEGRRIAFVDKESSSGYIFPADMLEKAGLRVPGSFSRVDFLGSHDAVIMAVLLGEYDAGAVFDKAYATVAGRSNNASLRVLAQTDPIPGEPIVASRHLAPEVVAEVKQALLSLTAPELTAGPLKDLFGFEAVSDEQYDDARLLGHR